MVAVCVADDSMEMGVDLVVEEDSSFAWSVCISLGIAVTLRSQCVHTTASSDPSR